MNSKKQTLVRIAIRTTFAALAVSVASHAAAAEKPTPVQVTNTVPVSQSGTWSVEVVNSQNREPFQQIFNVRSGEPGCGINFCDLSLGSVPVGKTLHLTHVQGGLALATGDVPLAVTIRMDGVAVFDVPRNSLACYNDTLSVSTPTRCPFNEEIQLMADEGASLGIFTYLSGSLATGSRQVFVVSGYYEDATPAPALLPTASPMSLNSSVLTQLAPDQ